MRIVRVNWPHTCIPLLQKVKQEQLKRKSANLKASGNNVHCVSCLLFLLSFVSQVNCMDVNTVRHIIMFIIIAFEISNRL